MTAFIPRTDTERGTDADSRDTSANLAGRDPLDAEAALWLARRQDGLSAGEEAQFQAWLAGDPTRGAAVDRLAQVLLAVDALPPEDVAALRNTSSALRDGEAATAKAQPALSIPRRASSPRPRGSAPGSQARRTRLPDLGSCIRLAATTCFALVLAGGGWLGWHHWQTRPVFVQAFESGRGQQLAAALPDGSTLRLDTATRVEVALHRRHREVRLSRGRAMFEVRSDTARPFHVLAGPMRVTVLGTRFSVRHTDTGLMAGRTRVVVEEGRVRVTQAATNDDGDRRAHGTRHHAVELVTGQSISADAQGRLSAVASIARETAMAWRSGRVVLDDTPLDAALAEFERYVDTGLVVRDPAVASLRLNGSFDVRQVDAFARALPRALPVRLVPRPDGTTEVASARIAAGPAGTRTGN